LTFNSYIDYKIREALRELKLALGVIITFLLMFAVLILKLVHDGGNTGLDDYLKPLLVMTAILLGISALAVVFPTIAVRRISRKKATELLLKSYKVAYYIKYTILSLCVLTADFGFLYYSRYEFMWLSGLCTLLLLAQRPTKRHVYRLTKP
jgi:hypothetical protein